jgi:HprK-related kinase A
LKVAQIEVSTFLRHLKGAGVWLRTGPFQIHLQSRLASLGRAIHLLYGDFPIIENPDFADFHIRLSEPNNWRRFYRPQVYFYFDDQVPFKPLPRTHAFAMFEWCLNWCVESQANHFFMLHAAIVERQGHAAILAAPPGSGKSTLTAGLINRGWRLLSDELTLIDPADITAVPLARPVSLKNESIDLIANFAPHALIGPIARDTIKGSVAHLKPPTESVHRVNERVSPRWVVFPRFEADARLSLTPYPKPAALLRLADHAFNYSQYGVKGFQMLVELMDRCDAYALTYSRLDEAIQAVQSLPLEHGRAITDSRVLDPCTTPAGS